MPALLGFGKAIQVRPWEVTVSALNFTMKLGSTDGFQRFAELWMVLSWSLLSWKLSGFDPKSLLRTASMLTSPWWDKRCKHYSVWTVQLSLANLTLKCCPTVPVATGLEFSSCPSFFLKSQMLQGTRTATVRFQEFLEAKACHQGPPPAIPYIFKFENGSLHLCGPADGRMHRATNFDGPGLCIMDKVDKMEKTVPLPMPRHSSKVSSMFLSRIDCAKVWKRLRFWRSFSHWSSCWLSPSLRSFEPDPEFSRNTTESVKDAKDERRQDTPDEKCVDYVYYLSNFGCIRCPILKYLDLATNCLASTWTILGDLSAELSNHILHSREVQMLSMDVCNVKCMSDGVSDLEQISLVASLKSDGETAVDRVDWGTIAFGFGGDYYPDQAEQECRSLDWGLCRLCTSCCDNQSEVQR